MAMPHKILRVFNTFKGLDTSSSDYERSPHHATTAQNLMLNDQGSLITRYGIQAHTTDATKQGFGILPYVNDAVPLIIQNTGIAATTDELITIGSQDIVRWYTNGSTNDILSTTSGTPIPRKDYIGTSSNTYNTDKLLGYVDKVHVVNALGENPSMDLLKNCIYITGVSSRGLLKYDGHMLQEASLLSTWDGADSDKNYSEPALPTVDTGTTNAKRFKSDVEANTISSSEKIRFRLIKKTGTVEANGSTMGESWYAWSSPSPSTTVQWRADNEGWHDIEIDMEFLDECFEYDWEALATAAGITWGDYGTGGGNGGNNGIVDKTPSVYGDTNWLKVRYDNGSSIQYVELKSLSTVYSSYRFLQIFVKKITVTDWAAKRGTITLSANLWGLFFGSWWASNSSGYPTDYLSSSGYLQWQSDVEIYLTFKNQNMLRTDEEVNTLLDFIPMPSSADKNTINNSTIELLNTSANVSEEIPIASVERNYSAPGNYGGRLNFKDAAGNPKFIKMYGPWSNQNNLWTLDQKGPSAYRYLYQKVHKDAKGNIHYGTPSSQHLDDTENGSFRQDIGLAYDSPTGVDFNELSIPFEDSATSNARGSLIIGGTTNKMYTLQCPSMPIYPVDTDAALTNNISCEIEVGDIVFAFNHGNTAGVGQCDEGVGGHTTKALCDEDIATGKQAHSDGADDHFNYLSREYRVLSKTDGGLIKSSGKTNGAGYTGSHDADNWKYWEIVVEPVVEGDPDWLFTGGADEFRAFTQFSGAGRDAADWEMWVSASNHRILIYRTKNIWYPDINSYIADPTYYLVEEIAQPANSYDSFDIAGFTAKKTVQFRDFQSDSSLAASEPFIVPDKIPGAAPKKCTLSATYNNQLILSGDPDNPTTVYYSDYDAPENFPQGTNAFNVDEKVTAIKTVGQVLYIFQQNKIHMMSGDLIQDNFRVSQIASGPEIGTLSHHSLTEVEGSLFFTNKNGVFAIRGNQIVEVSKLIKKTFTKLKDDLDKRWNRVSAYNWKERDIFVVYIPNKGVASGAGAFEAVNNGIEGADGSICLAYDYKRDAWFDWTVIRASGGFAFFNNKLYYTYLSEVNDPDGVAISWHGHLVSFEKTASGTLGDCEGISDLVTLTGIPAKYGTHWESLGDPATPKKFLRLKIYSADSDGYGQEWSSTSVNVKQQKDFTPSTIATKSNLMIHQSAKKYGMTKLNGTKCMSCRFLIEHTTTNEPLVIKGIEVEVATPYKPGELKV